MNSSPHPIDLKNSETENIGAIQDYISLLKPRVMSLVVFTAFIGLYLAPMHVHPMIAITILLSIAIGSGAAGALNMWYERESDCLMSRTQKRPLPQKKLSADSALAFGSILSFFSVFLLGLATNWFAATLLLSSILYYVLIYTVWLKTRTPQNIVVGGAAGAFPPLVGWAGVMGSLSIEPIILFLIIFIWTPPHFWALALYKNDDYKRAKIPMMPLTHGAQKTKWQMLYYTLALTPLILAPYFIGFGSLVYLITASVLQTGFLFLAIKILFDESFKTARIMFSYSIFYLFILFSAFIF